MKFTDEFLNDLRQRIVIEDILGDYLTLKKAGRSLVASCPFHSEKTPSFHVSTVKKLFHCFGCKKGGDTITFLMERENYNFVEAVKWLCERYGIDIPESARDAEYDKRVALENRITAMNHIAVEHWKDNREQVAEYLEERELDESTIEEFQFGYSLDSRNAVIETLQDHGFSEEEIKISGLVTENEKGTEFYDRFRERLMIPILDIKGRVVAVGGRTLTKVVPKYINSPETPLYVKGEHLYGLFQAREAIKHAGYAILTEGYFDTITLYDNGVRNVVASLGTALTDAQIKLLKRFTDKVLICYDGDEPGQKAAEKTMDPLNDAGFTVKILVLPQKLDPDDYIRKHGVETFNQRRQKNVFTWFQFYIERLKSKINVNDPKGKSKAVEEVLKRLALMSSEVERREYFDNAMKLLKVDSTLHSVLWAKLYKKNKNIKIQELVVQPSLAETQLLELVVANDTAKTMLRSNFEALTGLSITTILEVLADLPEGEINFAEVVSKLEHEEDQRRFCAALVNSEYVLEQYGEEINEEVDCCIIALRRLKIEAQLEDISNKIKIEEEESALNNLLEQQVQILNSLEALTG